MQQQSAPHHTCEPVKLLNSEIPNFISLDVWSLNSPNLKQLTLRYGPPCRNSVFILGVEELKIN